jgi:hypothetical protein
MLSTKVNQPKAAGKRLRHAQWLSHIEICTRKQLSAKEYCAEQGLSLKGFKHHDWLERRKRKAATADFAFVKVVSEPIAALSHYELIFPRGVHLRLSTTAPLPTLFKSLECYL